MPFPAGTVHLHVTDTCNLRCLHCYSDSSPKRTTSLEIDTALEALSKLSQQGYRHLSVSGGEPTLEPRLGELALGARRLGYSTAVVTNGQLQSEKAIEALTSFDTVAVSLDGLEANHDLLRNKAGSFRQAAKLVEWLARAGVRVGVVSCVSDQSLEDVPGLYELGSDLGASLFQVRPLVETGRSQSALSAESIERLGITAALLASLDGGPTVQCDLATTSQLAPSLDWLIEQLESLTSTTAEILSPLVIDEVGNLRPYSYNLSGFELGSIHGLHTKLDLTADIRSRLVELHKEVRAQVINQDELFVDWFALLADASVSTATQVKISH